MGACDCGTGERGVAVVAHSGGDELPLWGSRGQKRHGEMGWRDEEVHVGGVEEGEGRGGAGLAKDVATFAAVLRGLQG